MDRLPDTIWLHLGSWNKMVKKSPLRLSKKKDGKVTIRDGVFKIEVKERWRMWAAIFTFFGFIFLVLAFILPALIGLVMLVYIVMTAIATRIWRAVQWIWNKVWGGLSWVGMWCIKQPINDYRHGRHKRKDFERSKTYGK